MPCGYAACIIIREGETLPIGGLGYGGLGYEMGYWIGAARESMMVVRVTGMGRYCSYYFYCCQLKCVQIILEYYGSEKQIN